eukprot:4430238-Amphidinium_carterae.1
MHECAQKDRQEVEQRLCKQSHRDCGSQPASRTGKPRQEEERPLLKMRDSQSQMGVFVDSWKGEKPPHTPPKFANQDKEKGYALCGFSLPGIIQLHSLAST